LVKKYILFLSNLKGILILNDGTKYMGEFENGLCNGLGLGFYNLVFFITNETNVYD
jgi:hypothetical protein